ncbi:hypothetical protein [Allopontixanthobacter sp.]|uniref:hypothetical protein n=1 Tax=Allopontixanthobacter sp. TaxID=2906452 RepID=UPI002AB805EE|nr:hypothetical protein [Allopontixanthobacter sp.]MDZ4308773.1 hypothetical protein [Allopontixanthobacter sp.]
MKNPPVKDPAVKNLRALTILPVLAAASLTAAGCVPRPPQRLPPPMSQPAPAPAAAAVPMPPIAPAPQNWMDAPATPGDWVYRATPGGSQALFGAEETEAEFMLQCTRASGQIALVRVDEAPGPVPMRILTETQDWTLTATPAGSHLPTVFAQLPARDPLLDAMALSKGRFAVETTGMQTLYLPSWPEISRVIEDCR